MGDQVASQHAAPFARAEVPGKPTAGPKGGALTQLASALNAAPPVQRLAQRAANRTGLPDHVKHGVEALSGMSMDHVRVHYNSPKPAQLNAHAYAQGSDIHVAPGQAHHVPHEAWHVVQQAQGRVRATTQLKGGVALNDDAGLEREADRMGALAVQRAALPGGRASAPAALRVPATPVSQRQVIQAVRSVAEFQAQTPARTLRPRNQIAAIDGLLATYITAGAGKLAAGNALVFGLTNYIGMGGRMQARVNVATQLRTEVNAELPLVTALGAHAGLTDELIRQVGGVGNIAQAITLANTLTPAHVGILPQLIALAMPPFATLDQLIQHIQPANAHLLVGMIPAAGGAGQLADLDTIVQHATAAHALSLYTLIPAAIGAGLPALDQLIVAAGVAQVPALQGMIANAGGHGSIPLLTNAITLHHPGQGQHAMLLTQYAAGNAVEFARITALLPNFARAGPGAVPAGIQPALDAYNAVGHPAVHGTTTIPLNQRIQRVEWAHFLERHTMHYFDFPGIIAQNDQWPFLGAGADMQLGALVVAGLNTLRAASAGPAWWLTPNNARPVAAGAFTAQMGTKAGDTPLARPVHMPPGAGIMSTILGQFYPVAGPGVHVLNAAAMRAIEPLV
ncbi:eCIS core domain-containing protein [Sphingomonas sp.]|uniref:eCIS core domain-containing protein n=1 Tax=Sphingomonas sp. TaxID=28214 RepID=UPI003F6F8F92